MESLRRRTHLVLAIQLIAFVMALSVAINTTAWAAEQDRIIVDSGTCGNNLEWTLYDDGNLVITGTGNMNNYTNTKGDYAPWMGSDGNNTSITAVTIGDDVTSIGSNAFTNCYNLTSVDIGDSVTSIGYYAFLYDSKLSSVEIPDSVTSVGESAFWACGFKTLEINGSSTSFGKNAFGACDKLESVVIRGNGTSISEYMFTQCHNLSSVIIEDGVTSIGEWAFKWCSSLVSVEIPDSVTSISTNSFMSCPGILECGGCGDNCCYAFHSTGVLQITGSGEMRNYDTVTYDLCPSYRSSIISVTISKNITSIGNIAFRGCENLVSIEIPDSVSSIGKEAFSGCPELTTVVVGNGITSIGNNAFNGCNSAILYVPTAQIATLCANKGIPTDRILIGKPILNWTVSISPISYVYTGTPIIPELVVTDGENPRVEDVDFEVEFSNNVDAGTATATIRGKGDFAGEIATTFSIERADIANANIATIAPQPYTGSSIEPEVELEFNGIALDADDFDVEYSGNVDVGTATVTLRGKGNFTGIATTAFEIKPDIADAYIAPIAAQTYTGSSIEPEVELEFNGISISPENYDVEYSDNVDAGTATVDVTGKGDFAGELATTFSIERADIAGAAIAPIATQAYTGSSIEPEVELEFNGIALDADDFDVAYSANVNVGTATVTLRGKGNFTGTATASFEIAPADIALATIAPIATQAYTGSSIEPEVSAEFNGIALDADDFDVEYSGNVDVGTATVTLRGKGNFTGTATTAFEIKPDIADAAIATIATQTYTGSAIEPGVSLEFNGSAVSPEDYDVAYSANVNAGTATVAVTGKGDYFGVKTASFEIAPADIGGATIAPIATQAYTGSSIEPEVELEFNGIALDADDFDVAYSANVNVGTATVTLRGKGNFTGTATASFEIAPTDIALATIAPIATQAYTGSSIEPEVELEFNGIVLGSADFDVEYSGNVDVGTATVTLRGKGNFTGTATTAFEIAAADIADATIAPIAAQTYTGSAIEPGVSVEFNGRTLGSSDYDVAYSGNVNAGTATVTVTGKGDYFGVKTASFEIAPADIGGATIAPIATQAYTGSSIEPEVELEFNGIVLGSADFDVEYSGNVDVGTATVTVTGKGDFTGELATTFSIERSDIAGATIASITAQTYTGSAIEPAVSAEFNGIVLDADDFDVAYSANVNAGTATVTLKGKGNFAGTATTSFEIAAADIGGAAITPIGAQTYIGSAVEPAVSAKFNGIALDADDFDVAYSANVNAGTATVTLKGKGNFAGTATATFEIAPADIGGATIAPIAAQTYIGSAVEPAVSAEFNGIALDADDFDVAYSGNVNAGTAIVTVAGKGNFKGTAATSFEVVPADISQATVAPIATQTYTGSAIEPRVSVRFNGRTLGSKDFDVEYSNNVEAGIATVIFTGKGNFAGSTSGTFKIVRPSIDTGTCGKNLTWTLDDEGTLSITGTGAMWNFEYEGSPWNSYRNQITSVFIDDGATSIGAFAFCCCDNLSSVTIPDSVNSIGNNAFWLNMALASISIPDSVNSIGNFAFHGCTNLEDIDLSDNITSIGRGAFEGCQSLTSITIPASITSIGYLAFGYCGNLESFIIDAGNNNYRTDGRSLVSSNGELIAYAYASGETYSIPNYVTSIGESVFYYCPTLTSVEIPSSVTSIGEMAFCSCESLTSIEIPSSVTSIGEMAFFSCESLTSIEIPSSVTSIGVDAFYGCPAIIDAGNCGDSCCYVLFETGELQIIGSGEMDDYDYLSDNTQPWYPVKDNIISFTVCDGVTSIGDQALYNCGNLTSVSISDSVCRIGDSAFMRCDLLESIVIPDSVEVIDGGAFFKLPALKSVSLGESVRWIGPMAFRGCTSLTSIILPDSVYVIEDGAFLDCTNLASVDFGSNVYRIGQYAFSNCPKLACVVVPDSTTIIDVGAFYKCTSLVYVRIGNRVSEIGDYAFALDSSLAIIVVPSSVTSLGEIPFYGCDSATIYVPSTRVARLCSGKGVPDNRILIGSKVGWTKIAGYWYYINDDGSIAKNEWVKDSNGWCYLGADGKMATGTKWIKVDGDWYHLTSGHMDKSKWMKDSKGWCWLQANGKMLTNGWAKDSHGNCWIGSDGYMVTSTKWIKVDGDWYHITKGYMDTNKWVKDGSKWCYLGADGLMAKNTWKKDSKGWCYLGSDGYMVTNGWAKDSHGYCWIGSDGYMVTSTKWIKVDGDWYHITKGYMDVSNWMKDSKGWCYVGADGKMVTNGFVPDSHGSCWIGSEGYMIEKTMLVEFESDTYGIRDGYMVISDSIEVDGETYTFGPDGKLIQ